MYFKIKNTLKSNCNHTPRQIFILMGVDCEFESC